MVGRAAIGIAVVEGVVPALAIEQIAARRAGESVVAIAAVRQIAERGEEALPERRADCRNRIVARRALDRRGLPALIDVDGKRLAVRKRSVTGADIYQIDVVVVGILGEVEIGGAETEEESASGTVDPEQPGIGPTGNRIGDRGRGVDVTGADNGCNVRALVDLQRGRRAAAIGGDGRRMVDVVQHGNPQRLHVDPVEPVAVDGSVPGPDSDLVEVVRIRIGRVGEVGRVDEGQHPARRVDREQARVETADDGVCDRVGFGIGCRERGDRG